jgi:hypothetical protein
VTVGIEESTLRGLDWNSRFDETSLTGLEVYPVGKAESVVRIPDGLIKSVGFVSRCEEKLDGEIGLAFGGTAFIVGVLVDAEAGIGLAHLVTAKHVAEAIEPGESVIAVNARDGLPRFIRTGDQHWFYHPTEASTVDVAVLPFGSLNFDQYDIVWIPEDIFATESRISEFNIGLGDEIFAIGLFTRFYGKDQLTPLVRSGSIAMMPKEAIPTSDFGDMEAYLVEGRSIGGLSGSPVFVRHTINMPAMSAQGKPATIHGLGRELHLLGLMHGHWDVPVGFPAQERAEVVNMGVSIVVPAKKILETLYHPELVRMRKEHIRKQKNESRPVADSIFDRPLTKDEFEATLKKVSRKIRAIGK